MPALTANEINTQQHVRAYIQLHGPGNPLSYAGTDATYMVIQGVTKPKGDISPINVPDPRRTKRWRQVATTVDAPDLISGTIMAYQKIGAVPRALDDECIFNYYDLVGCGDLSNPTSWKSYIQVYSRLQATEVDYGDRQSFDSDDPLSDTYSVVMADTYRIGKLSFGEVAGVEVTRNVVDIVYGAAAQCGADCGGIDTDGTEWLYALVADDVTSGALQAYVTYSVNSGSTWVSATITGVGVNEQVYAIDVVGNRLVVLGEGAYYHATIDSLTGSLSAFTKVTSGFDPAGAPRDMYVLGSRSIYFAGLGGYIYMSTDITSGVSVVSAGSVTTNALNRITGDGENEIVAVGASGTAVRSDNRGRTFGLVATAPPTSDGIISVAVPGPNILWIGTDGGELIKSTNGGATWATVAFAGSGSGQVDDIVFATRERGYFSYSSATPTATLFATWDGGNYWFADSDANLLNVPTFGRANRLAYPASAATQTAVNNLAVAGLSSGGTDGVIYLGIAAQL